jgi:DNA-directed RNA polymerase subunit RPC12/RpoP
MEKNNNPQIVGDVKNDATKQGGTAENIETFFRQCPNCGKRFEIRLVGKKLVGSESIKEERPVNSDYFGGYSGSTVVVGQTEPTIIEVEKFQYAYQCKHCGHKWLEIKEEDHKD